MLQAGGVGHVTTTSYDWSSNAYDVQLEKLFARAVKSSATSFCPCALRHAPKTLTDSFFGQGSFTDAPGPLESARQQSPEGGLHRFRSTLRGS